MVSGFESRLNKSIDSSNMEVVVNSAKSNDVLKLTRGYASNPITPYDFGDELSRYVQIYGVKICENQGFNRAFTQDCINHTSIGDAI